MPQSTSTPTPRTARPGALTPRQQHLRRRTLHTAAATSKALAYRTLSGIVATLVDTGRLIRTGDALDRFGGADLPDGQQSWFGRHVAKAYRAAHNGAEPIRVWAQHRTTGRFCHVFVYAPTDPALPTGLRSYKATRYLADQATYARCA